MKPNKIKIAVIQMNSDEDVQRNLDYLFATFEKIKKLGSMPRLLCTPENSLYMRTQEGAAVNYFDLEAKELKALATWCKDNGTNLHLGSLPLKIGDEKFNSSILIRENGKIEASYQKVHLFDIHLTGQKPISESDAFSHGKDASVFEIDGWKFGQTICYDLRFSELYHRYQAAQVDAILIPAAFLVATGRAHWEILLRARAIESQAYVLAAAQAGLHGGEKGKRTFGHSMIIDPWGMVLYDNPAEMHFGIAELSGERINAVRTQIPMADHRRLK